MRADRSLTLAVASAALALGCGSAESAPRREPAARVVAFHELLSAPSEVAVSGDSALAIRRVNAGAAVGHALWVSDVEAGNVKVLDLRTGRTERAVGAPGDGPGEFRHVIAFAPSDSGRSVATLDQKRNVVSFRDTSGRLLREVPLASGSFGSLGLVPRTSHLLAGGLVNGLSSGHPTDLHEFDAAGKLVRSFAATPRLAAAWAGRFSAPFFVQQGERIAVGALNSNQLRFIDGRTGHEETHAVAPGWYRPLEWPGDESLKRGYSTQTAAEIGNAWMRRQRLMNALFPLRGAALLARFQSFGPDGNRIFHYAVVDSLGATVAVSQPTSAMVLDTRGDTLFWIAGARGSYRVGSGVMRQP